MSRAAKIAIAVAATAGLIVLGLLLVQFIIGLKYKPVVDTKTNGIDSFGGAANGEIYYVQNSRLLKKALSNQKTTQLTQKVAAQTQLSPDQKQLFYTVSSAESGGTSGLLRTLSSGQESNIPGAGNIFWFSTPLYYAYVPSMIAGSIVNQNGDLVLPTYPYSYISNFGNSKFAYTYGEGSAYDLTLKIYDLSQGKETNKIYMNKFASGPVFFGDYMGYLNTDNKLVVFGQDLQPKNLNLPVPITNLTQQNQSTQYYIQISKRGGDQIGDIYELDVANGKAQQISSANFTALYKKDGAGITSIYYDKSTDSLFVQTKDKLYTISNIHKS